VIEKSNGDSGDKVEKAPEEPKPAEGQQPSA
jgi:hypothetical protein